MIKNQIYTKTYFKKRSLNLLPCRSKYFMETINKKIELFLSKYLKTTFQIEKIEGSASDRINYRISTQNQSYILTEGNNITENHSFFRFAEFFNTIGDFTPKILAINEDETLYLQEDVGKNSLLDYIKLHGENDQTKELCKKCIKNLILMQIKGKEGVDESWCYDFSQFDYLTAMHDLYYFKNYFLDLLSIAYSRKKLLQDFDLLAKKIDAIQPKSFMHRDFQSRNIMVKDNKISIIDFQGGMMGLPIYDLVSFSWQSRANFSHSFKQELKQFYLDEFNQISPQLMKKEEMEIQYELCLVIRLLQVLGAYGFRGIYQKKTQFIESILQGVKNLNVFENLTIMQELPYLNEIGKKLTELSENELKTNIYA